MPRIIITAGPTREYIDPIRYITNGSSGKQGYAFAEVMTAVGWDVVLVSGPTNITPPNCHVVNVISAQSMCQACIDAMPCDVVICTAAVTDWQTDYSAHKIKKHNINVIKVRCSIDILYYISNQLLPRPKLVVGFSLESDSENSVEMSRQKMKGKGCDWIISNTLNVANESVMGSDVNKVTIISGQEITELPVLTKREIAKILTRMVADYLNCETE